MSNNRIVTVDFARGLLAIGVLFYHTLIYEGGPALPQIGRHGVYAFFVISGFALYTSYRERIASGADVRAYFLARLWRIAPLYYAVIILTALVFGPGDGFWTKLFFNASFLFGFANPGDMSLVVGGWSIGVEMAFYAIFPAIILTCGGNILRLGILAAALLVAQALYAHSVLTGGDMVAAWVPYTQPITFGGYFATGCFLSEIYRRNRKWKGAWPAWLLTLLTLSLFVVAPRETPMAQGWELVMTGGCLLLVAAVAFLPEPQGALRSLAEWFGRMSYPVYLLHPLVYHFASKLPLAETRIPITMLASLVLSDLVNRSIERPAMTFYRQFNKEQKA